jgi:hypothetical protein
LSTVLTESWATRQVDYTNAFAQAAINEEIQITKTAQTHSICLNPASSRKSSPPAP